MKEYTRIKCNVCGCKFEALAENRYTAREIAGMLSFVSPTLYDAFDCPRCGCQCIAGVRKESVDNPEEDECSEVQPESNDSPAE